jgi:plasmid stabilization system protein ParE
VSRFEARLEEQVERIETFPESGLILFESYRRVLLRRFPHMAVYLVGANRIDVLAVVAVRRDPAWIETTVSERADD